VALSFSEGILKTIVYVDGYNLYYGLLKSSAHKWLDLFTLFNEHVLDKSVTLIEVRYYTAPVLGKMSDHPDSSQRQRIYLQALRKMPPHMVKIIEGKMLSSMPYQRLVKPIPEAPHLQKVQVFNFTEKKTDVNIAADMISDAWQGRCEQVVLCSNDSDHERTLANIKNYLPHIRIGLIAPILGNDHRKISADLVHQSHWQKILSPIHLAKSQLPQKIPSTAIQKPKSWD
jgi:uncharacterized LabA/DUF88 family protein